eukprot:COSAG04_NODE_3297_length_2961_cov_1.762753_3_plen_50_part_00
MAVVQHLRRERADRAGFENGDDECFYDKSELPANGDGGWVKDVGSCARG